jgi:hypothetical protein
LLNPAPERRDDASRMLAMCPPLREHVEHSLVNWPAMVAARSRRIAALAPELADEVEALRQIVSVEFPTRERNHITFILNAATATLARLTQEALRFAKPVSREHPKKGRPHSRSVRGMQVAWLESIFREFHVSRWPSGHLRWMAERNRFLHAALDVVGLDCDRRQLERDLAIAIATREEIEPPRPV